MSDVLDRFHQVLLREISEARPEYLTGPFTVAEIYQNLVPYRSHRDLIGVEMNGDYEDALLRLLAGEGDYLILDSEVARREIREELESPNPNTGLFRDFAAADVRLNPTRILTATDGTSGGSAAGFPDGTGQAEAGVVDIEELGPDEDDTEHEAEAVSVIDADAADPDAADPDAADPDAADPDAADPDDDAASGADGVIGHIELVDDGVPGASASIEPDYEEPLAEDLVLSAEDAWVPVVGGPEQYGGEGTLGDEDQDEEAFGEETSGEVTPGEEIPSEEEQGEQVLGEEELAVGEADGDPEACPWCRQSLPSRKVVNFCPFCGSDMRLIPCPKCGEELEPRWQFCVSCGTEVSE